MQGQTFMRTVEVTMKNIYLYGASDDCCECETDFAGNYESYVGIKINDVTANYRFDGDWGIKLTGNIPPTWKVKTISGNCCAAYRDEPNAGQFIHIQIPEGENVVIVELKDED